MKRAPTRFAPEKRQAYRRGLLAEYLAILLLTLKGYRILARRWRCAQGEIDIIAMRASCIACIEVKARASAQSAMEAIGAHQRRRIESAAEAFMARSPKYAGRTVRFDLMVATPWRLPLHVADAWRP